MRIKIINGPNLNLLGIREKEIYGKQSYKELLEVIKQFCFVHDVDVTIFQSNSEGEIINEIHQTYFDAYDALMINPAAYTHYSIAIRDALASIDLMKIEVHLSDIYKRESFRHVNVIKEVVDASFFGQGFNSYIDAIEYVINHKNMDKK